MCQSHCNHTVCVCAVWRLHPHAAAHVLGCREVCPRPCRALIGSAIPMLCPNHRLRAGNYFDNQAQGSACGPSEGKVAWQMYAAALHGSRGLLHFLIVGRACPVPPRVGSGEMVATVALLHTVQLTRSACVRAPISLSGPLRRHVHVDAVQIAVQLWALQPHCGGGADWAGRRRGGHHHRWLAGGRGRARSCRSGVPCDPHPRGRRAVPRVPALRDRAAAELEAQGDRPASDVDADLRCTFHEPDGAPDWKPQLPTQLPTRLPSPPLLLPRIRRLI